MGEVEIEFYSNFEDEEMSDTVDQVIGQLIASYMDNESGEDVDLTQIFANSLNMEEINLDDNTMNEMNDLLNLLTGTDHQIKSETAQIGDGTEGTDRSLNAEKQGSPDEEIKMFAFKISTDGEIEKLTVPS